MDFVSCSGQDWMLHEGVRTSMADIYLVVEIASTHPALYEQPEARPSQ